MGENEIHAAARLIHSEVLHKVSPEGVALRIAMRDATLKCRIPNVTRSQRWEIVNRAIEALIEATKDEGEGDD